MILKNDETAANMLQNFLQSLIATVEIPIDFSFLRIDVTDEVIDRLANDAMDEQRMISANPRKVYKEDVIKIYNEVLPR
ncbi:hypothetical protein ACIQYS_01105 [Psychrobacillus sp. NPDC096426]|uniref:hypothetical protein n=1 Tax=Psychrobacillus sp. NPDC096426 TaxID=3364491 RepID=UPI00382976D9